MIAHIIFPQTAWTTSTMGFAGISDLRTALQTKSAKVTVKREYQAIILTVDDLDAENYGLVSEALPDDYHIPAIIDGKCVIISRSGSISCSPEDPKFQELMRQAHLQLTEGPEGNISTALLPADIDRMCDVFADIEGIPMPLVDFNIERLSNLIPIDEKFTRQLIGVLTDIKTLWFALEYDELQAARNTAPIPPDGSVEIYGLPKLRGGYEEQELTRRFKRYVYISDAIVRIRALWDKLIGLAVLLERPEEYDRILGAKRVRSAFIKNFKNASHPVTHLIWDYVHSIDPFEERFRTPELHKIGRAVWWTTEQNLGEEMNRFLAHRNDLNRLLRTILDALSNSTAVNY